MGIAFMRHFTANRKHSDESVVTAYQSSLRLIRFWKAKANGSVRLAISPCRSIVGAMSSAPLFVVMGVSGVGKSVLGEALATRYHGEYLDADSFHPPENIAKMKSGAPLTDQDRAAWLDRLNAELRARAELRTPRPGRGGP